MRRAFIRSVGVVSPLGASWPETWAALLEGGTAIAPIRAFDTTGFPCQSAAEITDRSHAWSSGRRCMDLASQAANEAWNAAGRLSAPASRIGIFVGAESGRPSFPTLVAIGKLGSPERNGAFDHGRFGREGDALGPDLSASHLSPAAVASTLAKSFGARGPVRTFSVACASGSLAISSAARAIRLGVCDVAIAGGVGADVDPTCMAGFGLLSALSAKSTARPFDRDRDGFVLGEGAAMTVLASEPGGSMVEVVGAGRSLDALSLTAPAPDGEGAARAMRAALAEAKLERVDHVEAHGTGTILNDAAEAAALAQVLGKSDFSVTSSKGALGHWIAGAGALGFASAHQAIVSGVIPAIAGLVEPDPELDLPLVMGRFRPSAVSTAMINSFAFGGVNSSIVLARVA
ncbi:MAG: hypothetical protein HYV07_04330 [Deltaproteobacteria bacterium]|nr:hypothetical protein [Deltaproteobacteria bacterium]